MTANHHSVVPRHRAARRAVASPARKSALTCPPGTSRLGRFPTNSTSSNLGGPEECCAPCSAHWAKRTQKKAREAPRPKVAWAGLLGQRWSSGTRLPGGTITCSAGAWIFTGGSQLLLWRTSSWWRGRPPASPDETRRRKTLSSSSGRLVMTSSPWISGTHFQPSRHLPSASPASALSWPVNETPPLSFSLSTIFLSFVLALTTGGSIYIRTMYWVHPWISICTSV